MQLDYMVLADYVRQDNGVVHIIGAGIDTIQAPRLPSVQQLGVALRISFDAADQVGEEHRIKLSFVGPEHPVLTAEAILITPPHPPEVPEHWRIGVGVALQMAVPLSSYGDYTCEVAIDDGNEVDPRSFDFRVIPTQGQNQG
jgi:Family of unknown function (DUF6941)